MGQLAPQDTKLEDQHCRILLSDWGSLRPVEGGGVIVVSHPYLNGVIGTRPREGAPCEGQMLQDHTCMLTCVVQEEW